MNTVYTGIDVLAGDNFALLSGQRIGLVTNHTGLSSGGDSTIDLLHQADGLELKALFGPEHGLRGEQDERVSDGWDEKTQLPIYSLYGTQDQPTKKQLEEVDAIVFDIQDVGCRFYTYISTLVKVMEAASENGVSMAVLDRPNPITGISVEGPLPDPDKLSFTACHSLPVRHGMTVGELALLIHSERQFHCPLQIVRCEGWQRRYWFDQTGLLWTNPSPNMRSLAAALLYPGIGLLEMTNLSVGRGTDTPFEVIGAPFINGTMLAGMVNEKALPGLRAYPIEYTPQSSVFAGERCAGVRLMVVDRDGFDSVQTGLTIAACLHSLFSTQWKIKKLNTLLADQHSFDAIISGTSDAETAHAWAEELLQFHTRRQPYLLYS